MQALQAAALTHVQDMPVRWQCDSHGRVAVQPRHPGRGLLNLIENAIQASGGMSV
jgi:two-component system sensor histidine kinase FlrB